MKQREWDYKNPPKVKIDTVQIDTIIFDMVWDYCSDSKHDIDTCCNSVYENACDYLVTKGYLRTKDGRVYRLTAKGQECFMGGRRMNKYIDHQYTKDVICPYCGENMGDDDWHGSRDKKVICWNEDCEKEFILRIEYDYDYITEKTEEE